MKLSKQTETAILQAYCTFWAANLSGNMKVFGSYLLDDFSIFGSANGEVFLNKKDAIKFYTATAAQMKGKAQLRNRNIAVQPLYKDAAIVHEQSDLYLLIDNNWTNYGHARISCVLKLVNNQWKAVHQHASFPDYRTEAGEQVATQKIKTENLQLREAVKRRTAELELKNKELEIDSALEKVRTVAMGMKEATDMLKICKTIAKELAKLGLNEIRNIQTAIINEAKGTYMNYEFYAKHDKRLATEISYINHPMSRAFVKKMLSGPNVLFQRSLKEQKVKDWYAFQKKTNQFADSYLAKASSLNYYWYSLGPVALGISAYEPLTKEQAALFLRFSKVFQLSYRRYLDIEKATAQAREARIETTLERIRAASMAMKKSEDMMSVAKIMFKELKALGFDNIRNTQIAIEDKQTKLYYGVDCSEGNANIIKDLPYNSSPLFKEIINEIKKSNTAFYQKELSGAGFKKWKQWRIKIGLVEEPKLDLVNSICFYLHSLGTGIIGISTYNPVTDAQLQILKRCRNVFELSYRRFTDIQKAEAQAREGQIQLALERVRSRSIAMQKSAELKEVIQIVYDQFVQLKIPIEHTGFVLDYKNRNDYNIWIADKLGSPSNITIPYFDCIYYNQFNNAKKKKLDFFAVNLSLKEKNTFYRSLYKYLPGFPQASKKIINQQPALTISTVLLQNISLYIENFSGIPFTDEANSILMRFAKVFEQAYTRFLDLQKAETQAKEAQIETALEKVRSRTMAMQNSNELQQTAAVLFQEFKKLGTENIYQVTIGIYNEQERLIDFRVTNWADDGAQENRSFRLSMDEPTVLNPAIKAWKANKKSFVIDLTGKALDGWLNYRNKISGITKMSTDTSGRRVISVAYFSKGHLSLSSPLPLAEETIKILERFASVFDGTYTRFLDLEKAEAQAREAHIEAALEKVRSRTLAMQSSNELSGTAAVLFQQLIALGIAPNRLYIILMKEDNADMEAWVTDEDGSKVSMGFTGNYQKNASLKKMYDGWLQHSKSLVIDMQGDELKQYFNYLHNQLKVPFIGGLEQKRRIQHIAYFSHGLIGMASPDEQPAETLQLLERFAAVFNLTFTRFNDLKIAEAHALQAEQDLIAIKDAKQKAEAALTELQATQQQLIQSEKMASLGELTAGIAHEIQNPLNFVNNFSEVSKELLQEMSAALANGDTADANDIMNDVIQNLEKINQHGKRADGIVKGMLQHSRSSSGQKELTDINALCDEYLRLAYHGLRAKDKSFNAKFETSFDDTVGKLKVIPQELGRVILNLINNAFYAVSERKKLNEPGYEPTVTVSTVKQPGSICIMVKDNGTGMPPQVVNKIFQPFFTTKPTGQGTGLGLSLSYDIITKGHGGELKVDTKEGAGAAFIILLTVNS
ncbi:MAG: hypothetical protein RL172_453 [Bacteroidota bacterium]|jgi:signal transduction histidine kinase